MPATIYQPTPDESPIGDSIPHLSGTTPAVSLFDPLPGTRADRLLAFLDARTGLYYNAKREEYTEIAYVKGQPVALCVFSSRLPQAAMKHIRQAIASAWYQFAGPDHTPYPVPGDKGAP